MRAHGVELVSVWALALTGSWCFGFLIAKTVLAVFS